MMLRSFLYTASLLLACSAPQLGAQATAAPASTKWNPWQEQHSGVSVALRGIHATGNGVAWASGDRGTVLRTEDSGFVWQRCAVPPDGGSLDFRSVWAWDANNAIVMSSGPGKQSRLYKTSDGCAHWRLLYTNKEPDGFWDAIAFADTKHGFLLGDPVRGQFVLLSTSDGGEHWASLRTRNVNGAGDLTVTGKIGSFAASNSALALTASTVAAVPVPWFGTSGVSGGGGPFVYTGEVSCSAERAKANPESCLRGEWTFTRKDVPLAGGTDAAGLFSMAIRLPQQTGGATQQAGGLQAVGVGGDYTKPSADTGTAAYRDPETGNWMAATKLPSGYRSAVAWDEADSAWIAVGLNGADVSYDDGKTWSALGNDGYNAISLPWVVGPEGRIGKLVSLKGK